MALSVYSFKDWYKSLCGLIVLMAIFRHESMPGELFGITGLNPWNLLFLSVVAGWFISRRREGLRWDMPAHMSKLLLAYFAVILIAILRAVSDMSGIERFYELFGVQPYTGTQLFLDRFVNGLKFLCPALLLFHGCNSKERFIWAYSSLLLMYLILALLVIKVMPLSQITDGHLLETSAKRILGRDLGIYRTNLSVMLAGGFWMFIALQDYMERKYSLIIFFAASLVLIGLFLTAGRGGYVACFAVGLVFILIRWKKFLILAPIVIALIVTFIPSVADRVGLTGGQSEIYGGLSQYQEELSEADLQMNQLSAGRSDMWPPIIEKVKEKPFVGWGYYGVHNSGVSIDYILQTETGYDHPHNAYLQLALDSGVLLAFPIVIFFICFLRQAWILFRVGGSTVEMLAGTAGLSLVGTFLVAGLTGQTFYPEERSFGMWCAMMLSLRIYVEHMKLQKNAAVKIWETNNVVGSESSLKLWGAVTGRLESMSAQSDHGKGVSFRPLEKNRMWAR
jgi:O-antigen ligase